MSLNKQMLNKNKSLPKELQQIPESQLPKTSPKNKNSYYASEQFRTKRHIQTHRNKSQQNIYNFIYDKEITLPKQNKKDSLPSLTPPPRKKNKSVLDKILDDREKYAKIYFMDIDKMEKEKKEEKNDENEWIDFEFPQIRVNKWKVKGYVKGDYILLRGKKGKRSIIKKYKYSIVYDKVKKNYMQWVEDKFCFQN